MSGTVTVLVIHQNKPGCWLCTIAAIYSIFMNKLNQIVTAADFCLQSKTTCQSKSVYQCVSVDCLCVLSLNVISKNIIRSCKCEVIHICNWVHWYSVYRSISALSVTVSARQHPGESGDSHGITGGFHSHSRHFLNKLYQHGII